MPTSETVRLIPFDGNRLDAELVARVDARIRAVDPAEGPRVVLDCSSVSEVTPQGLAALLELGGRNAHVFRMVLAALPKPMLRAAVDVGLAERFAIYANVGAAERALSAEQVGP